MIKTILVPIEGGPADHVVFRTALAAAQPFAAHLQFVHVRPSPGEAARQMPGADFALGQGLVAAIADAQRSGEQQAAEAAHRFEQFCTEFRITITDSPAALGDVTASLHRETNDPADCLVACARHSDLVVMGRAGSPDGFPSDMIERILLECGRPILIAPAEAPRRLTGTVMICWRESPEAARALAAAWPFLTTAERVVIASVDTDRPQAAAALSGVVEQLSWHGIEAQVRRIEPDGGSIAAHLAATARDLNADLMVAGAYGHSRVRELIFGGVTKSMLAAARLPVFLVH